jgi:hypothetical protein
MQAPYFCLNALEIARIVMRPLMRQPVIFDGRNLYHFKTLAPQGFTYYAIGRTFAPHDGPRPA